MMNWKGLRVRCAVVIGFALGAVCCGLPSAAVAGGVHFGFGVEVPFQERVVVAPPVQMYSPPVVVERRARDRFVEEDVVPERVVVPRRVVVEREPVHRVVIEQPPTRIVVEPVVPRVVVESPAVVERRSTVTTWYSSAPRCTEYCEETTREYHEHSRNSSYYEY